MAAVCHQCNYIFTWSVEAVCGILVLTECRQWSITFPTNFTFKILLHLLCSYPKSGYPKSRTLFYVELILVIFNIADTCEWVDYFEIWWKIVVNIQNIYKFGVYYSLISLTVIPHQTDAHLKFTLIHFNVRTLPVTETFKN